MKKILAILMTAVLLMSLTACGNNDSAQGLNPEDMYPGGNGATDMIYGQTDDFTKQAIIDEAKREGMDVSFGEDGSAIFIDPDGSIVVQQPDGSWVVQDESGTQGQVGGNWPDNEFTRLIPKPSFAVLAATTDETSFTVVFSSATLDQVKEYAAKVKDAGFNIDARDQDNEYMGMIMYDFSGIHAAGYSIQINYTAGSISMIIDKNIS